MIGILYIVTGRYLPLFDDFYQSSENFFLMRRKSIILYLPIDRIMKGFLSLI